MGFRLVSTDVSMEGGERYAVYTTLEEAKAQGDHDLVVGDKPLRVEDEATGLTVYAWVLS